VRYLFVILGLLALSSCSQTVTTPATANLLIEEQEFILEPTLSDLSTSATTHSPRLIVRLSLKPQLDVNGRATGKRYGQASFFWTDKSRSNGGSNLGGIVSIVLRDPNNPDATAFLTHAANPIMTNIDL
jgi:hypothetical protein